MDYSYAKSRKEKYRASNQGSSTDRLDATRKTLGATQREDGSDYGFEWLNGGYDWVSSRREEYGMSRRDATEGWDNFGATMRDDIGNSRRDNLGRTTKENLGATRRVDLGAKGDTRREDFGASASDGLRATGGNPARDSRSDNLEMPYYRQLQDTDIYRASRQNSPTPATYPSVEPYDYAVKESDYSVNDGQETGSGKPRRWTSVAADRDLMQEWHAMFGQIRTKWAPSSGLDDPATVSKWSDGKSSSNSYRPRRNLRIAIIVAIVAVVVLVAVIVPTLLFTLGKDEEEVLVQYEYSAKITNREYSDDMANSSSEAFRDIENEFCGQLDQTAANNSIVDFTYNGCALKEIKNGSLIIIYIIVIKVSRSRDEALPTAAYVSVSVGITVAATGEQNVGVFTVVTVAVTIVQPIVITENQNPVKKKVQFNGICSNTIKERCITKRSKCIDGVCKCPVDRSHTESADTCTQIDCGDNPIIDNGTVTSNGTKYGSTLNITCDEGFELSDNTTIYCTSPGSWGDMPSCIPVECPEFITPNNSEVDTNTTGRAYTDVINITCVMGYKLDSNLSSVTCFANQSWSEPPVCSVVTCMVFYIPDNVGISPRKQKYEYNDNVTIDCDTGYQVQAEEIVRCQPNGTWTDIPICVPIECEMLTIPNNAGVSPNKSNFVYNENASIECDTGYQIQGNAIINCQANGTWKDIPKCEPVECDPLIVPENAATVPDESQFVYKENVTIECDTGYLVQGNEMISCQADGTWKDIPKCDPVDCEPLIVPDNAAIVPDESQFVYKENVTIECDTGYQLQGIEIISCQANGTWKDIPKCDPVDCEPLIVPDNAVIVPGESQFVYKENVTIECDTGYQLQGIEIISCQANGTWKDIPKCDPVDCEPLIVPDNAAIAPDESQFVYKENVTIECDTGYQLQGIEIISCQANGTWKDIPKCDPVDCEQLIVPDNAVIVPDESQFVYKENVTIGCDTGYLLQGNEIISCQADGTWKEIPTCYPVECVLLELPDKSNFQLDEQQYKYNETVVLECENGYEIQGNPTIRCQSNASWTEIPTCKPINCSALQLPANAETDSDITDLNFDDAVFITCESGFILEGDSNISCNADGTWPILYCVAVNCSTEDFTKPDNSIVSNVNGSASAVEIDCVEGFSIVGNSTVSCIAGNWSEFPYCKNVDCGMYGFIENGNISSQTGTEYGDTVEIKCTEHFKLIGESQGTCLSNGSWTDKPLCKQIECEILRLPENADIPVNINDTIAGTVISLVCRDGYDLNGTGDVICQDNETWSVTPMCKPKDCGQPDEISNSDLIGLDKTTFDNSFAVACMEGYNLIGESNVYCQENGSWTDYPSCEIKDCGQIDAPDNGDIVNQTGTTVGSISYIKCDNGFDIVGKENLTCLTTGNWDNLPSCQKTECDEYTPPEHTNIGPNNTIICNRGYDLTGEGIIECLNGSWSVNGQCELVQCSNLPKIDNANLTANAGITYYFEDTIDVLCNYGFEISGDSKAKCGENKTWVSVPSCNPVHCKDFHVPPYSEIGDQETTSRVFGDIINVTCSIGFDLEGDSLVVCNASGEWENDPSCKPKTCPSFEVPSNATVGQQKLSGYTYGDAINITCNEGYFSANGSQAICGSDGEWENTPNCVPVSCPEFTQPENSKPIMLNGTASTFAIECLEGYIIDGNSTVTCNAGNWTEFPYCKKVDCGMYGFIENGNISSQTGTEYGDIVEIKCTEHFKLIGENQGTCLSNGSWTDKPLCKQIECEILRLPENADIPVNINDTIAGTVITLVCRDGYDLNGTGDVICQDNETWSVTPMCQPKDCGQPDEIANSDLIGLDKTTFDNSFAVACMEGYNLIGESNVYCQENGSWTDYPSCEIKDCGQIDAPDNGDIVNQTGTTVGSISYIKCDDGFDIVGKENLTCLTTGNWDNLPSCQKTECGEYTPPEHTNIGPNNTIICNRGYDITGEGIIECLNGSWSVNGQCELVQCSNLPKIDNANLTANAGITYYFEDTIDVLCNYGFEISGDSTAKCGENKTWVSVPSCNPVHCKDFHVPPNSEIGDQETTSRVFGDIINVTCSIGFDFEGDSLVVCNASGEWENDPSCKPKTCPSFEVPSNATVGQQKLSGYTYGDAINITCNEGYFSANGSQAICGSDGEWENTPNCVPVSCPEFTQPENSKPIMLNGTASTFEIECLEGYIIVGNSSVTCNAGNWTEFPTCEIIDCGPYEPSGETYTIESSSKTTYNTSLSVTCVDGLELTNDSAKIVSCDADGQWNGHIDCKIPGAVSFTQTMYAFAESATANITCEVNDYQRWQTVLLAKADPEGNGPIIPIFMISNVTGSVNSTTLDFNYTADYTLENDGISVSLIFNTINCDNEGLYTCAAVVGEPENATEIKSSSTLLNVSCMDCGMHEPINDTYVVDENGKTTFSSSLAVTCVAGLEFSNVSVNVVTCEADGKWHGEPDCKIPGAVSFTQAMYAFAESETQNITCEVKDYPGWQTVLLAKADPKDNGPVTPIFMISNVTGSVSSTTFDFNYTADYTLENDGISVSLIFNTVTCDNEGLYTCAVVVGEPENATKIKSSSTILNASCIDCGMHEPITNTYVVDENGETTFNSSLAVTCVDGLEFSNVSVNVVTCEADGNWHGEPDCKIPGAVSFTQAMYAFAESETQNITCEVKDYPGWQTVLLAKADPKDNGPVTPIFMISNVTGSVSSTTFDFNYTADYTLENDGISVSLIFNTVTCDNEGLYTCAVVVGEPENATKIKSSSTILNASCIDCGMHEPITNTYVVDENGETTFNSSLAVTCVDGLEFSNVSVNVVTCEADGNWHGEPDCKIPGAVSFTQAMYAFAESETQNITCEVKDYPGWQTVLLAKADPKDNGPVTPIFMISNVTGSVNSTTFDLNYTAEYTLENDGISVSLIFSTINCDNEGLYTCAAVVGEPENATEIKSSSTLLNVSCIDCGMHEPINDTYVVDENGKTTFSSSLAVTCVAGLEFSNVSVNVVTCEADGKWHGEPDCKIPGAVSFTQATYAFAESETQNITCEVKDYPGWQTVLLAKVDPKDNGPVTPIFMISNVTGSVNSTTFDLNYTAEYTLENDGISVSLIFSTINCDNEGLYTCAAVVGEPENATEIKSSSTLLNVSCIDCGMHEPINDTYVVDENGKTTFSSSLAVTCVAGLEFSNVSVNVVTCEADGKWHGEPDCKIPGAVSFTQAMYAFAESETQNITCEVKDYPGWQTVLLAKADPKDNGPVTPIFMISNVTGSVSSTTFDFNYTADYTLENDGISVSLIFNTITCDNEGLYTCAVVVGEPENATIIKSSSTILNASCIDCGMHEPITNTYVVDENGETTFNSSLAVTCVDGLEFSNVSVNVVTCEADGNWHGGPDCEIPGLLSFTNDSYVFKMGKHVSVTCQVTDYPNWKTLLIGKFGDENGGSVSQIFMISNETGSVENTTFDKKYTGSYTLNEDGPSISLEFNPAMCENEGMYICAAFLGEFESPIKNKLTNTTVNISTNSSVPEITVPDKIYFGREAEVACTGLIGKGESGQAEGQLLLETNFGDNGNNVTFNGSDTPKEVGCYFKHSISVPIPTSTDTSDLWAQCVIRPTQGVELSSEKKDLHILTSFVAFRNSSYVFDIGNNASITCDVQNIPDWKRIEIRRFDGEVIIGVNSTSQSADSNEPHISLVEDESSFANDSATFSVLFDSVKCSDAMGSFGDIEYTCAVMTNNSTIEDMTTVTFQWKPEEPVLTMSREIIENKYTLGDRLFYCEGDAGGPAGTIEVQSNFNGTYETFLAPMSGLDNNTIGWIVINETDTSDCMNYRKIGFAFHNVTMDMQYKRLRCVIHPSDNLLVTLDSLSDEKSINIVPADICVGKVGYVPHPYFCDLFVECDKTTVGQINGVPEGCNENECFNDEAVDADVCVDCSIIGGCNITGIKCDKTHAAAYNSETISFTCDTQDFGEVTHISIKNQVEMDINATEMSIQVIEDVYLKASEGYVILSFLNVSCDQEDEYVISLNNRTDVTLSLVVVSDPDEPNISVPDTITANQEVTINCSGKVGRDEESNSKTAIYLELMTQHSSEFALYNEQDTRMSSEGNCEISETVMFSVTPNVGWNNSHVRCVTKNDSDAVTYSSQKPVVLQTPALFCEPVLKASGIAESVMFTCALKDITEITSVVFSNNTSELINEDNVTLPYVKHEMQFTLSIPSINEVNLTFTAVSCEDEGDYTIVLNDAFSATLILRVVTPATEPSLNKPSKVRLNERLEISCTGDVGRNLDGNAATNMSLEVKFANESEFSVYNENVEKDAEVLDNCRYTQTLRLIFYPGVGWNNSEVRCVTLNNTNVVQSSTTQVVQLLNPNTYFKQTDVIGIVGESVTLTCVAGDMDGLSDIVIKKGETQIIIASYTSNSNTDDVTVLENESYVNGSSGVLMINMTVQCGHDGKYYCEATGGLGTSSETVTSLSVQRKPGVPKQTMSREIIENKFTLDDRLFYCEGDVGDPPGTIEVQSNFNGSFETFLAPTPGLDSNAIGWIVSTETNTSDCMNYKTICFAFHNVTMDMQSKRLKCVIHPSDELSATADDLSVENTIDMVPADFCVGKSGYVSHPYFCHLLVECDSVTDGKISGVPKGCEEHECYNSDWACVECSTIGGCNITEPTTTTTTTTTTPSPNSTYIVCENLLTGTYNENGEVTCSLNNFVIDLNNLTQSPVIITADNSLGLIFNSSRDTLTSNSFMTTTANEIVVNTSTITLKFVPLQCQHIAIYTFRYSDVEGSSELEVVANVSNPIISKQPGKFYRNQEVKITCSGDVGRPKGNLVLKVNEPGENEWTEVTKVTKSENETASCTTFMSVTYAFYVDDNMEGHQYICEAIGVNEDILESEVETVTVSNAVVYFTEESETVQIGSSLQLKCVLEGILGSSGAVVSRNSLISGDEHLCNVSSSGSATCSFMNINGMATENENNLTAIITINAVRCEDEGTYYCESASDTFLQASSILSVTKPPSGAVLLSLPKRMVLDMTESFGQVTCEANVGYPAGDIRIEYSSDKFETFDTYSLGSAVTPIETIKECSINKTISYKEHTFTESWNETDIRCAVYNHTEATEPVLVSDVQQILLIENQCTSTGYYYHPFNCHYYIVCIGETINVNDCGMNCPDIENSTLVGCFGCDVSDC